jgi:hypothetical protein
VTFQGLVLSPGQLFDCFLGTQSQLRLAQYPQSRFIVWGGARWCIGSGATIPILRELWLSDGCCIDEIHDTSRLVTGPFVQSLINTTNKTWNLGVIQQVFSPGVSQSILTTPLIDPVVDDILVWKAEKTSFYSVKSAYKLCVEVLTDSSHLRREGYWQGIWRLKVPPKIRNLVWRICRNIIPTGRRLQDKGVQCPLTCVVCNEPEEDLDHICFNCPFSVQVWQHLGFWTVIQQIRHNTGSMAECIFALLQHYNVENS